MPIKSKAPNPGILTPESKLPAIPPGAAAASAKDSAAFATPNNLFANPLIGIDTFLGPFPTVHWFVFEPNSDAAVGKSHSTTCAIPNNPSAFSLNILAMSPGNISPKSPIKGASASFILPIILFKIPDVNWSAMQGVKLETFDKNGASKLAIFPSNLSVTFFIAQGIKLSIPLIDGTFAIWAACAAFLAKAGSKVSSKTLLYSDLYSLCNPSFNFGAIPSNVDVTIADDILVAEAAISFDASLSILNFCWEVAPWKSFIVFSSFELILLTADLAPPVSPAVIVVPMTVLATLVTSPVISSIFFAVFVSTCRLVGLEELFWSPASFCWILSFGFTLLVYPVYGANGSEYCLFFVNSLFTEVLGKTPNITGCCALSPSRKNPSTLSPGDILVGLLLPAAPDPASGDTNTCAQGNSSFFNSISSSGWYPRILTLNLFPHPPPSICDAWTSSGAIWPIHHLNPSLPKKLLCIKLFSIILLSSHLYLSQPVILYMNPLNQNNELIF